MNKCEKELLLYKLKELKCKKCCDPNCKCEFNNFLCGGCKDDGCDVCICGADCDSDCCCDYCSCSKKDSICDCCVDPLEFLLSQLKTSDELKVFTDDNNTEFPGTFICVNNSILSILSPNGITVDKFPLCHIGKIESDAFNPSIDYPLELEKAPKRQRKGGCECCEEPIRRCLQCACGLTAFIGIQGENGGEFQILKVGEGVVIAVREHEDIYYYTAIPVCKITLVEIGPH